MITSKDIKAITATMEVSLEVVEVVDLEVPGVVEHLMVIIEMVAKDRSKMATVTEELRIRAIGVAEEALTKVIHLMPTIDLIVTKETIHLGDLTINIKTTEVE